MNLDLIINFCETLPGATAIMKIEDHLTYNVGGKSFIWFGQDQVPVTCSFKCSEEDFDTLSNREGFIPAPYMARNKWIQCQDIGLLTRSEMETYILRSYQIIRSKLPRKVQDLLA